MSDARRHMLELASQYYEESARAHSRGMGCARQSARIEQLERIVSDAQAEQCVALFIQNGMMRIEDGKAVLIPDDETSEMGEMNEPDAWSRITTRGGKG